MVINTITEAKAQLSALIEKVLAGEEIVIKRAGKPVAVLKGYEAHRIQRSPGALKDEIYIAEDFDILPPEIEDSFGMGNS